MSRENAVDGYPWWAALNHGGLLIAPSKLVQHFPETAEPLDQWRVHRLRRDLQRADSGSAEAFSQLLDTILVDVVGLKRESWLKGPNIPKEHTHRSHSGEALRPARLWQGDHGSSLAVFLSTAASQTPRGRNGYRLGTGAGRRAVVRVVEWLRKADQKVALLATPRQLRLIHAGPDYEAYCEWDLSLWFQDGQPGLQVDALRSLLSPKALVPETPDGQPPLLRAIAGSRDGQSELSAALGERVRRAVELLIQAGGAELLRLASDAQQPVPERDIYLAATRVIRNRSIDPM